MLYRRGLPSSRVIFPPACSTTQWAAAVSHSEVSPIRGYRSGRSFSYQTKFQRTAHGYDVMVTKLFKVFAQGSGFMGSAAGDGGLFRRLASYLYFYRVFVFCLFECTQPIRGKITMVPDRDIDHTENRFMIVNQSHIDREFAIFLNEFLGAVQGIY